MKKLLIGVLCVGIFSLGAIGYGRLQVASALSEYSDNMESILRSCSEEMADFDWYVQLCGKDGHSGIFSADMDSARNRAYDNRRLALLSREEVSAKLSIAVAQAGVKHSCSGAQRVLEPRDCGFMKARLNDAELKLEVAEPIWLE